MKGNVGDVLQPSTVVPCGGYGRRLWKADSGQIGGTLWTLQGTAEDNGGTA